MFSPQSLFFLTVEPKKLKFFSKSNLIIIDSIISIMKSNNIKKQPLKYLPFQIFIKSLQFLSNIVYASIILFLLLCFTEPIHYAYLLVIDLLWEYKTVPYILIITTLISFIIMKIIDSFVKREIAILQQTPFETNLYIEKLSDILEPYESLKLFNILKENEHNLFGLVILKSILDCMDNNEIKDTDLLFDYKKIIITIFTFNKIQ